jgi:3-deoxy-7-phosphoheptulonate synthase
MRNDATQQDVEYVIFRAHSLGLETHISRDSGQAIIGLLGDLRGLEPAAFSGLRGVDRVVLSERPFRLASRDFRSRPTIVTVGEVAVGGNEVVIIAGPCAVESCEQLLDTAHAVKQAGARLLRGGAFKPRTSPYSFDGLGEEGLRLLAEARAQTGLPVVTEVMSPDQVSVVSQYADVLQVGARNMLNYSLLHAVGASGKPVLLKRGMMSTVFELLMSAEYILSHGNRNVMLCERGIRTFETATRNTLDLNAVPLLREMTHLPVIVDPSHATGKASLVPATSKGAIAAGADGLLLEVHRDPENAFSDGYQSLDHEAFSNLMKDLRRVADAVDRQL